MLIETKNIETRNTNESSKQFIEDLNKYKNYKTALQDLSILKWDTSKDFKTSLLSEKNKIQKKIEDILWDMTIQKVLLVKKTSWKTLSIILDSIAIGNTRPCVRSSYNQKAYYFSNDLSWFTDGEHIFTVMPSRYNPEYYFFNEILNKRIFSTNPSSVKDVGDYVTFKNVHRILLKRKLPISDYLKEKVKFMQMPNPLCLTEDQLSKIGTLDAFKQAYSNTKFHPFLKVMFGQYSDSKNNPITKRVNKFTEDDLKTLITSDYFRSIHKYEKSAKSKTT